MSLSHVAKTMLHVHLLALAQWRTCISACFVTIDGKDRNFTLHWFADQSFVMVPRLGAQLYWSQKAMAPTVGDPVDSHLRRLAPFV